MKRLWLKVLAGIALLIMGAIAGGAARNRLKAKDLRGTDDEELLQKDIERGADEVKRNAKKAMKRLDRAKEEEARLDEIIESAGARHENLDSAFDRYRARAKRGMRNDP